MIRCLAYILVLSVLAHEREEGQISWQFPMDAERLGLHTLFLFFFSISSLDFLKKSVFLRKGRYYICTGSFVSFAVIFGRFFFHGLFLLAVHPPHSFGTSDGSTILGNIFVRKYIRSYMFYIRRTCINVFF